MNLEELKKIAAEKAVEQIPDGISLGIGSGSTVLAFVAALKHSNKHFSAITCASQQTTAALEQAGFRVDDLNSVDPPEIYIDSCDEINPNKQMIKGGGAALTREKILAAASQSFICITTANKQVEKLGKFPLPLEVIPMARSFVGREILKLGGEPRWRQGVVSDNGNWILDVHYLDLSDPMQMEQALNQIPGVVCNGIFAAQSADTVICANYDGQIIEY